MEGSVITMSMNEWKGAFSLLTFICILAFDQVYVYACSDVSDSVIPWTVTCQAPLSRGFLSQEYWNGLPFLPPGDLPDPEVEPPSLVPPALAGKFFTTAPPGKPPKPFYSPLFVAGLQAGVWSKCCVGFENVATRAIS